jgi:hypothetical protein
MKRFKLMMLVLASAAAVGATAASAQAAASPLTFNFYDCTGPTGTPAEFSAVRVSSVSPTLAFHRTDGEGNFVVLLFNDEDAGVDVRPTFAPGLVAKAQVTCSAVGPLFGHQLTVSGFFTP